MESGVAVTCFLESWMDRSGWESTLACALTGVKAPHAMAGEFIQYASHFFWVQAYFSPTGSELTQYAV